MKTAIATDSNSGFFPEEGKKLGIFVIPMPVVLDGISYFEGVDLTHGEFYAKLNAGVDASTSQPAPGDVLALWEEVLESGYDQIVYIPMSSGLSASYETAKGLAEEFDGKVLVANCKRVSVSQHDAVVDAKALADRGLSAKEICDELERLGPESVIYLGVETLHYFRKNGRCTAATAALGTVLNIKPLLRCDGERFDACAKVRGTANCKKKLLEEAVAAAVALKADGPIRIGVASSMPDQAGEQEWFRQVQEAFPGESLHYEPLSFSVTCHTGPGAFGLSISHCVEA